MSELVTTARPYARAAYDTAVEQKTLEKWSTMLAFMSAVANDPTMRAILDSPRLSADEAAKLLITVCEEQLDKHAKNFVKLLAQNDRLTLLPEITALYEHYRSEAAGEIEAEVVSAKAVDQAQLSKIAAALKTRLGRNVKITSRIDESLLGGAIIRAGDVVIDGSVRGKLNKLSTILAR